MFVVELGRGEEAAWATQPPRDKCTNKERNVVAIRYQ